MLDNTLKEYGWSAWIFVDLATEYGFDVIASMYMYYMYIIDWHRVHWIVYTKLEIIEGKN